MPKPMLFTSALLALLFLAPICFGGSEPAHASLKLAPVASSLLGAAEDDFDEDPVDPFEDDFEDPQPKKRKTTKPPAYEEDDQLDEEPPPRSRKQSDEYNDEEEEEDSEFDEDAYDDWSGERKGKKKKKSYSSKVDAFSLKSFKSYRFRLGVGAGAQYNMYSALRGASSAPIGSLSSLPAGSTAGGANYNAWPSAGASLETELYFFQSGAHSLGLDISYEFVNYFMTITLSKNGATQNKTAINQYVAADLKYRFYPFKKQKSLVLMPRAGFRYLSFDGNDVTSQALGPLFFFVDYNYYGPSIGPLNFVWFLPVGGDEYDFGFRVDCDLMFMPAYIEGKRINQYTGTPAPITGDIASAQMDPVNIFAKAGITLRMDQSWGLELLAGYYGYSITYLPIQGANNTGMRGGGEIYNAVVSDQSISGFLQIYWLF